MIQRSSPCRSTKLAKLRSLQTTRRAILGVLLGRAVLDTTAARKHERTAHGRPTQNPWGRPVDPEAEQRLRQEWEQQANQNLDRREQQFQLPNSNSIYNTPPPAKQNPDPHDPQEVEQTPNIFR